MSGAGDASGPLLLDTNALIWVAGDEPLAREAEAAVDAAYGAAALHVSAVSAWEVGMLRSRLSLQGVFRDDVARWFREATSDLKVLPLDAVTALESTQLPDLWHRDPADRFLIAAARTHALTLVTRDVRILDYAARGHVKALAC
jgi:PIN domain nuclease of toxin-antitoxin system